MNKLVPVEVVAERLLQSMGHFSDEAFGQHVERLQALMAQMHAHRPHPEAPSRQMLFRAGERWSSLVMLVLALGPLRHAQLQRVVSVLSEMADGTTPSQRMLTLTLRTLERDGLLTRSVGPGRPPRVDYAATVLGEEFAQHLLALVDWSNRHAEAFRVAQERYDKRQARPR